MVRVINPSKTSSPYSLGLSFSISVVSVSFFLACVLGINLIANSPYGFDNLVATSSLTNLITQMADVNHNGLGGHNAFLLPNGLKNLIGTINTVWVTSQEVQDTK